MHIGSLDGCALGTVDDWECGVIVGCELGDPVGSCEGSTIGKSDGLQLGWAVGCDLGSVDGLHDG